MADISDKLTYLNKTKGLIKKGLNDLGADLTDASSFRSYANVLSGMYDDYPKVTGEGTDLLLSPTKQGKLAITPQGVSSQFSTDGKQLFDKNKIPYFVDNGASYSVIDTGIRVSLTATSDGTKSARFIVMPLSGWENKKITIYANVKPSSGQPTRFIIGTCDSNGGNRQPIGSGTIVTTATKIASVGTVPATLDETNNYLYTVLYAATQSGISSGAYTDFEDLMILEGEYTTSTIPSYEPYTGGIPAPNPDYPFMPSRVTGENAINVTGKNFLPVSLIESQVINGLTITNLGDGTIKVNGTATTTTRLDVAYLKTLKANTTYTWHNYNRRGSGANVNIQDSNGTALSNIILNASTNTYTPTTDVSITKMRFYIDSGQSFNNYILKVQLEEGSSATTYEPYQEQNYQLSLGDIELNSSPDGTIRDAIIGTPDNWFKREYIGKVVLNGSENISIFNAGQQNQYFKVEIQNKAYVNSDINIGNRATHYISVKNNVSMFKNGLFTISNSGDIVLCDTNYNNVNNFKQWLSENNVTVYYRLAQYTDIPITDTTLINQLNDLYDNGRSYDGITNITSTYENGNEQMVIYAEALMDISDSTKVKINEENLTNIANTLRTKNRTTALYTPAQMPAAIETIGDMGDISNGIIEEYLTTSDTIDANTFVEFVNTNDYTLSTDTELSSSYYSYAYARAVKLNDTKVFIVHNSNTDTMGLNGMICEINGGTITHGADTVLSAAYASSYFASPVVVDENTVFISHSAGGDNPGLNGIVCTISGLVITPGTDTVLVSTVNSFYSSYATPIFETRAGWVLVTHMSDENNYYLNGIICHISGTTITHNTDAILLATMGSYTNAKAVEIMGGQVVVIHPRGTKLNGFVSYVSTINGGDLTPLSDIEINSTSGSWTNSNLLKLDSSRILITHANNNDNAYLNAVVCNVSTVGTTIVPGTDTQLEAATGASNGSYPVLLEEDKVFIAHGDSYFDGRLKAAICTISGTTITLVLNDVIDSDVSSISEVNPVALDDTTVFISHCTGGDGHYMSLTLSGLIYKIAKKIKIAEDSIDGMTKEECSSTTAGDVWVLEPYVEVNPEDLM